MLSSIIFKLSFNIFSFSLYILTIVYSGSFIGNSILNPNIFNVPFSITASIISSNPFSNFIDNDLVIKDIVHLFPDIRVDIIMKKGKILKSSVSKFIKIIKGVSIEFSRNCSDSQGNKKNSTDLE